MKKSMAAILGLAVMILGMIPSLALAKLAVNHNQTQLRGW